MNDETTNRDADVARLVRDLAIVAHRAMVDAIQTGAVRLPSGFAVDEADFLARTILNGGEADEAR